MKNTPKMPQQSSVHPISNISISNLKAVAAGECTDTPWPDLCPLDTTAEAPNSPPMEALGDIIGSAAKRVIEVVKCPDAIAYHSFLAGANLAAQMHANVKIDGRVMPISNFYVSIAHSGERKSGADYWAMQPFKTWEQYSVSEVDRANEEFQIAKQIYDAEVAAIMKDKKRPPHAKTDAIKLLGLKPLAPVLNTLVCEDATFEGLVRLLADGHGSLGLFTEEGGKLLGGNGMSSENKLKMLAGLTGLWDSGCVDKVRLGEGTIKLYDKRLSMHLLVQPGIARRLTGDADAQDQGFLGRCLITSPDTTMKTYVEADLSADLFIADYQDRVMGLLPRYQPDRRLVSPGFRVLQLSADAKRLYISYHDATQDRLYKGEYDEARAQAAKAHDLALRIACVLQVFDGDGEQVSVDCYHRATMIIDHSLGEHMRLQGRSPISPKFHLAQKTFNKLREIATAQGSNVVKMSEHAKNLPSPVRNKRDRVPVLGILLENGYIRPVTGEKDTWEIRAV